MSIKFCEQCNNMLFPTVNEEGELKYACASCGHKETADTFKVFTHVLREKSGAAESSMPYEIVLDPTYPRTKQKPCPLCNQREAVFFQLGSSSSDSDALSLWFVCCNSECRHRWKQ